MTITFDCNNCGRVLTTSEDRAGQKAKCPGCGEVVTVPTPIVPEPLSDTSFSADESAASESPPAARDASSVRQCPMCGMENPRSARKCQACGEAFPDAPSRRRRGKRPLELGEAMSTSWEIFKDQLAVMVGSTLILMIPSILWIVSLVVAVFAGMIWLDEQSEEPLIVMAIAAPVALLSFATLVYLSPGYNLMILGVARGEDVGIRTLLQGGPFLARYLLATLIFMPLLLLGMSFCVVPGVFVFLMWWAYAFVLVDENPPGVSCLTRAKEIMEGNWGQVFVVLLVGTLINMFASQVCQILGIFSQAYFAVLMAVTYLRITGQPSARERQPAPSDDDDDDHAAGIDE